MFSFVQGPISGILIGTPTSGQSGPGSNGNEGLLNTFQVSRTRALSPNAVYCHARDILF